MEKCLFEFIEKSPTPYHTADNLAGRLMASGYSEIYLADEWNLADGGLYFTRRGSSFIAFKYRESAGGFVIAASHSDTPTF